MISTVRKLSPFSKAVIFTAIDMVLLVASLLVSQTLLYGAPAVLQNASDPMALFRLALLTGLSVTLLVRLGIPYAKLYAYEDQGLAMTLIYAMGLSFGWWALDRIVGASQHTNAYVIFGGLLILSTSVVRLVMLRILNSMYRRDELRRRVVIYVAGSTAG